MWTTLLTAILARLGKPYNGGGSFTERDALDHAWAWFELHSKQRMQTVNFYMVLMAALLAGCAGSIKDGQHGFLAALGIAMVLVSALFYGLDRRARQLVKLGEAALEQEQKKLALLSNPGLNLVREANKTGRRSLTYGRLLTLMFCAFACGGVILSVAALLAVLRR